MHESRTFDFHQAAEFLKPSFDLNDACRQAFVDHLCFGLVEAHVKAGTIANGAEYPELFFERARIREAALLQVLKCLQNGHPILPIFDAGGMKPAQLFEVLFSQAKIPHHSTYAVSCLDELRRIGPEGFDSKQPIGKAFKSAYSSSTFVAHDRPRVLFTLDETEVTRAVTSPSEDIAAIANGECFMDPSADFIRYRTQSERGFSPDRARATRYSDWILPNGHFLFLQSGEQLYLGSEYPTDFGGTVGRMAFV
jgi:hypothetical protein